MKLLHNMPLRIRVTLLTGGMILLSSLALTAASMWNAEGQFTYLQKSAEASFAQPVAVEAPPTTSMEYHVSVEADVEDADIEPMTVLLMTAKTAQSKFNYWSILALALVAAAGMGVSYYVAGRALGPVRRLSQAAENIDAQNLQTRLPDCAMQDEIGTLTRSFNGMLERLQEAFESQRRFSSDVAHELKTPLATMKLCVQTARLEETCDEEVLSVTERSVDRLSGVVSDLLLLTNDAPEEQRESLSLPALLQTIAAELEPLYAEKQLQLTYDFPAEDVLTEANSGLARHVFGNLIENGMKYTGPHGGVTLKLAEEETRVVVMVADTGAGIPAAALPHLFEPFYCVDPSRSRKLGGAGLGLSIAKAMAEKHGWTITCESALGEGTCFTVSIPRP